MKLGVVMPNTGAIANGAGGVLTAQRGCYDSQKCQAGNREEQERKPLMLSELGG